MDLMNLARLSVLLLTATLPASGLEAAEQTPLEEPGLAIGQAAPEFTLKDQNSKPISLESLLKQGPVALVFVRSADWCLYCKLQLIQLQRNLKEIQDCGGQVAAISYDAPGKLKYFADKCKIAFPLLSDPESKVIEAYDIRNKAAPKEWGGVSRHGTFIIDQQAVIRAKLSQVSYKERPAVENLIKVLKQARTTNLNERGKHQPE
jgi:peroxiredoxin